MMDPTFIEPRTQSVVPTAKKVDTSGKLSTKAAERLVRNLERSKISAMTDAKRHRKLATKAKKANYRLKYIACS